MNGRKAQGRGPPLPPQSTDSEAETDVDFALCLLQVQQRLDMWDRLYNEEIGALRRELSQLVAEYVRQRQRQLTRPSRRTKKRGSEAAT